MPRSLPNPEPNPEPNPDPTFPLVTALVISRILGDHQAAFVDVVVELRNSTNPPPIDILEFILQRELTDREKLDLFRRLVGYVGQVPIELLRVELLQLQRTVEGWMFRGNPVQINPDSLISMVVTLAILATHPAIDAQPVIIMFQPFVLRHVLDDPNLTPLLAMLRRPENVRNVRTVWLENIHTAFRELQQNVQRQQDDMLVSQVYG